MISPRHNSARGPIGEAIWFSSHNMIDDTRSTVPTSNDSTLSSQILEIIQTPHRASRRSQLGSESNFLAFDDTADQDLLNAPKRKQECSRCYAKSQMRPDCANYASSAASMTADDLHVCNNPFLSCHKITEKDLKERPQRFQCDRCQT